MQHHRTRPPRKPRLAPLIAVFGVAAVTASVAATTAPTLQGGSGQANANADRSTGVLPGETTTTVPPTTIVSAPVENLPVVPSTRTTSPTTTTTETSPRSARAHAPSPEPTTPTTNVPPSRTTTTLPEAITAAPAAPTPNTPYPVGTPDSSEPSGMAPPAPNALSGYAQSYVNDFTGSSLPAGWTSFTACAGGNPCTQWDASHVVVNGGLLQINTNQDPAYNNEWVSGGVCGCGQSQAYGAYFVRSRVTGAGPAAVELLWPANNSWPPEIDFNETTGVSTGTTSTVHFGAANNQDVRTLSIDMTQWHTWGVIWTPTSVTYTVDGNVWGTVTNPSEIPNIPMTLDFQTATWCGQGWACPSSAQSLDIDWADEYTPN